MKLKLSRKLVMIFGGVFVLTAATGSAAVYIGKDTLLGPSAEEKNGLACTEVSSVRIKTKNRYWIRKYVTTEPTDGLTRVKTALRVAHAVYETDKPDLVQVVVLDKNGPKDRAMMRGRAIGADVIYIPDPSKVPEEQQPTPFVARYIDKSATASGEFYGEKIVMPQSDVEFLMAKFDDHANCTLPVVEGGEAEGAGGHGKAPAKGGHGEAAGGGHGEAPKSGGHGEAAKTEGGHGEAAKPEGGHGAAAGAEAPGGEGAAEGEGTPTAAAAPEPQGWFASIKGMVFGSDAPAAAEGAEAVKAGEANGDTAQAKAGEATPEESKGWFDGIKSMVFGSETKSEAAEATPAAEPAEPAAEPKAKSGTHAEAKPAKAMEAAAAKPVASAEAPAEDSDTLPPKASSAAAAKPAASHQEAKAGH